MQHVDEPKYATKLEDSNLFEHAASYPEDVRNDFIWFGRYVRDICNRNLDVLVKALSQEGHPTTTSTYAKVLSGRWFKSATGKPTPPIIALDKFKKIVAHLREKQRLAQMCGVIPFIHTPTFTEIQHYIDARRVPGAVCKFGIILGPTGAMKTRSFEQLPIINPEGDYHHMEAPDTPTIGKFYTDCAEMFGVARGSSQATKISRIYDNTHAGTCLIIDNVQRMYKEPVGSKKKREQNGWHQPFFSFIQRLQDLRKCTVILAGVLDFEKDLMENSYFEQFAGRCGGRDEFLILPEFAPEDDLIAIAEGVNLNPDKKTIKLLEKLSRKQGRIRIVFHKLQKAIQLAEHNKEKFSRAHLEEVCADLAMLQEAE